MLRKFAMAALTLEIMASLALMACATTLPQFGEMLNEAKKADGQLKSAKDAVSTAQRVVCMPVLSVPADAVGSMRDETIRTASCIVAADALDEAEGAFSRVRQLLNAMIASYTKANEAAK